MSEVENVDIGDTHTFVMRDGSLMTLLRHEGSMLLVGKDEFEAADAAINGSLAGYLKGGGHAVRSFSHVIPIYMTERTLSEAQAPMGPLLSGANGRGRHSP